MNREYAELHLQLSTKPFVFDLLLVLSFCVFLTVIYVLFAPSVNAAETCPLSIQLCYYPDTENCSLPLGEPLCTNALPKNDCGNVPQGTVDCQLPGIQRCWPNILTNNLKASYEGWYVTKSSCGGTTQTQTVFCLDYDKSPEKFCQPSCFDKTPAFRTDVGPNACCGDDNECMFWRNGSLCTQTAETKWLWLSGTQLGSVFRSVCSNHTILVGDTYYSCSSNHTLSPSGMTPTQLSITNVTKRVSINDEDVEVRTHDYACVKPTAMPFAVVECAGDQPSFSGGTDAAQVPFSFQFQTGDVIENVTARPNTTFYCTSSGRWTADLDSQDKRTCEQSDFKWTGSKCCGEPEDSQEFYNEPNKLPTGLPSWLPGALFSNTIGNTSVINGGCWNSSYVGLGSFIPQGTTGTPTIANNTVFNYKGKFIGCNLPEGSLYLSLQDTYRTSSLVQNNQLCTAAPNAKPGSQAQHAFCSYKNIWELSSDIRDKTASINWDDPEVPEEIPGFLHTNCCSNTSCWNGTTCQRDQSNDSKPNPIYPGGLRCVRGEWTTQQPKSSPDGTFNGFCPVASQCLLDPDGRSDLNGDVTSALLATRSNQRPQCLNDSQYFFDNYCDSGTWTSRTKLLGLQLTSIAQQVSPNSYTVYCDEFFKVLNNIDYPSEGALIRTRLNTSCSILGHPGKPCVNNVCVLRTPGGIGTGFSINVPINSSSSVLISLGFPSSACNGAIIRDGAYHACSAGLWYNDALQSVISLPFLAEQNVPAVLTINPETIRKFNTTFNKLSTAASANATPLNPYDQLFQATTILRRLYASRTGTTSIFSFVENSQRRPAGVGLFRDWLGVIVEGAILPGTCIATGTGIAPGLVPQYDSKATCIQNGADTFIFSTQLPGFDSGASAIIKTFPDVSGKLRPGGT